MLEVVATTPSKPLVAFVVTVDITRNSGMISAAKKEIGTTFFYTPLCEYFPTGGPAFSGVQTCERILKCTYRTCISRGTSKFYPTEKFMRRLLMLVLICLSSIAFG